MQRLLSRTHVLPILLGFVLVLVASSALAQYQSTLLVSDLSGKAKHTDPLLKNPWGLAYAPGQAFWVSDEASGWSTLYNGMGVPQTFESSFLPSVVRTRSVHRDRLRRFAGIEDRYLDVGLPVCHPGWDHQRLVGF